MSNFHTFEGAPGESFVDEFQDANKGYFVPSLPDDDRPHFRGSFARPQVFKLAGGGIAVYDQEHPEVYLVYPGSDFQVGVFGPSREVARGSLRPGGSSRSRAILLEQPVERLTAALRAIRDPRRFDHRARYDQRARARG